MIIDPHSNNNGYYHVHSLYFDDYKNTSLYKVEAGLSDRFKWRIRYYDNNLNYLLLEKKVKSNNHAYKKSCLLTIKEYNSIVSNNILDILYDTDKVLIKELAKDMLIHGYIPKIIVDYERIAYVEQITNTRITFDKKISASYEIDKFLSCDYNKFYLLPSNINLLEVKYDYILPSYIKKIVESYGFNKTSFSKYYYSKRLIDSYMS